MISHCRRKILTVEYKKLVKTLVLSRSEQHMTELSHSLKMEVEKVETLDIKCILLTNIQLVHFPLCTFGFSFVVEIT